MEESSGGGGAPNALFLQLKMQKGKKDQKLLGFSSVPAGETKSMSGLGIQARSALLVYYRNPLPRQAEFNLGQENIGMPKVPGFPGILSRQGYPAAKEEIPE
jgi:hypothetical protein